LQNAAPMPPEAPKTMMLPIGPMLARGRAAQCRRRRHNLI
jgi:hypothetical protein